MSTRDQIVRSHLERWRALKAWGRSISNVKIEVSPRAHAQRAGTCWSHQQRLVVYQQADICEMLSCGLHEMAHAVEIADHHGVAWQRRFAWAVGEATGYAVASGCEDDYHIMDRAAADAVRRWWRGSGHEFAAKLLLGARL